MKGTPEDSIHSFPVGRCVTFSKTVSESDVYFFAGITGDFDPVHINEEYCKTTPYGSRIAHGALIIGYMSAASSLVTQGFGRPVVSLGYDRLRIVAPVFIGDTITVTYTVSSADIERSRILADVVTSNQNGATVVVGTHIQKVL